MPDPLTDKQIRQFANDMLANSWSAPRMVEPILKKHGSAAMPVVTLVAKEMELDAYARQSLMQFLERAENRLGAEVVPALRAATDRDDATVAAFAIGRLLKLTPDDHGTLVDRLLTGLDGKARDVQRFAEVAGKFDDERIREALWALLVKKTPTVRQAAAEALGEHADDAVVPRATQLLADDAVHTRLGAAAVLGVKRTTAPLFERLRVETDADVRDALVKALGHAGATMDDIAAALPPVDNDTLLADAAKLKPIRFTWLDEKTLPPLLTADGPMDPLLVRYMLSRQSKQTSPALDVSIIGLVDQVDRARAGEFAAHLLAALEESTRPKQNSWVLILVGLLADNRVLGQLGVALKKWIKNFDAKLGGVALHALRWQGSDAALGMIADVAETYRNETRRKFKLAADTAAACLDAVAAERGVDRETLLDETVPTFGFDDNATRTIVTEKRT
ncbi:MAG: HEAT repeat domain-containing protein, partial [Planctomycetota bacterium]